MTTSSMHQHSMKVRERSQANLDNAPPHEIAQQLKIWTKDVERQHFKPEEKHVREARKEMTDALTNRIAELEAQMQRLSQASLPSVPATRMTETAKIPDLSRVHSGRSLLSRHTDPKVRVLNADSKEQMMKKATSLGFVSSVRTLEADAERHRRCRSG